MNCSMPGILVLHYPLKFGQIHVHLISDAIQPPHPLDLNFSQHWVFWISQLFPVQLSSVAQSCLTLCDLMDCSTPGIPVHHQLMDFQAHWVRDTIQPSHPLSSPSPPAFNLSQHQGLSKWVRSLHQVDQMEKEMATQSWRIPWTEEPGGQLSIGSHRVRHDWSDLACMHACMGEGKWQPSLKSFLMRVKEESEKVVLKLNIQKMKIMASGPITSWQVDGEKVEAVTHFIWGRAPKSLWMVTVATKLRWMFL